MEFLVKDCGADQRHWTFVGVGQKARWCVGFSMQPHLYWEHLVVKLFAAPQECACRDPILDLL